MKTLLLALALCLALVSPAFAQDIPTPISLPQVDRRLSEMLEERHIPGASVAIVERGQVTFVKGYGYADVKNKIPATADTPFRAGSISKALTAIGIMTLVESHQLSLEARLTDLAPEVHFVNPWEKTNPVRMVNLLEHTTAWPDISTRVLAKDERSWSTLQGVQFASSDFVSRWKPGEFMVYNNAGPAVAGVVLEKITHQSFDAYMRQSVLRPMGMGTADFDLTANLAKRIAKSYAPDGSETPYQFIVLKPAGSLNISARELAQLVLFFLSNGRLDGRQILSPESVARIERSESNLATPLGFTYGYGLGNAAFPDSGPTFRGHNGSIDSFTSVFGYNRQTNSGYVLMANGGEGVDFATPISRMVQSYLTRNARMKPAPTIQLDDAALQDYAGFYRIVTPPNALLRPYVDILNITHVRVRNGRLVVAGIGGSADFYPVSRQLFRRFDREDPGLAFVRADGHLYKISPFNAAVKESVWIVAVIVLTIALCLVGTLTGVAMLLPWLYFAWRRRLANRGGLIMRLMPLSEATFFALTLALPLTTLSGPTSAHEVADISPLSLTVLIASVLLPLSAVAGVVLALRNGSASTAIRTYVGLTSAAFLVVSCYLAFIGWFAVRTWAM